MKKTLLSLLALFLGIAVNAQFTELNAPSINDSQTLFLLDSNATAYDSETGNNAVWDYSATEGYNSETREIKITDAADTSANGTFNTSSAAFDIENFFSTYMTHDGSGKKSQGFIFNAESIGAGTVIARFEDTLQESLFKYPFNVDSVVTSEFEGVVTLDLGGGPSDVGLTGNSKATVDGEGTLKLTTNDYDNVLRYKLLDTIGIILDSTQNFDPDVQIVRTQYEYYNHLISNLPIFIYTDIVFKFVGDTENLGHLTIVLGYDNPAFLDVTNNNATAKTKVYPNPTNGELNIELPSSIGEANVLITDAQGREVHTAEVNAISKIDVSSLKEGIYFVNIKNDDYEVNQRVIID